MAGGWAIAQMCDLRLAAVIAMLGISEARWSLLPPFAATLTKFIPMAHVLELVFTAEPITAQRAYEIGFVNRVVPQERLLVEARTLAQKLVTNAPAVTPEFQGDSLSQCGDERSSDGRAHHPRLRSATP